MTLIDDPSIYSWPSARLTPRRRFGRQSTTVTSAIRSSRVHVDDITETFSLTVSSHRPIDRNPRASTCDASDDSRSRNDDGSVFSQVVIDRGGALETQYRKKATTRTVI